MWLSSNDRNAASKQELRVVWGAGDSGGAAAFFTWKWKLVIDEEMRNDAAAFPAFPAVCAASSLALSVRGEPVFPPE